MSQENLYHRDYYLKDCEGFGEFLRTKGRKLSRRLAKCLALAAVKPLERVIDVGAGRGELALHAAFLGAVAVAVDPSREGLKLLGEAITAWETASRHTQERAPFSRSRPLPVLARGEALPLPASWANALFLSDVVEHLRAEELVKLLAECKRVLGRGGRLIIHTQPNRTLVQFTIPFLSYFSRLWGVALPRDLRTEMTPGSRGNYHPGEQSLGSLRTALLKTGFVIDELWLEGSYGVHRAFGEASFKRLLLRFFRQSLFLKKLLATQIFALAKKP